MGLDFGMSIMDEQFVRARFASISRHLGAPAAKDIGQHEIVPPAKMEALDEAGHDEEVFVRNLAGKSEDQALSLFKGFQATLQMKGLREASDETFLSRFLRGSV